MQGVRGRSGPEQMRVHSAEPAGTATGSPGDAAQEDAGVVVAKSAIDSRHGPGYVQAPEDHRGRRDDSPTEAGKPVSNPAQPPLL